MTAGARRTGLPYDEPSTWLVLALSAVFVALGFLFLFAPTAGAALFGIAAPSDASLAYVVAIGLRDLALGLYLFAMTRLASRRLVGTILGITVLIPVGDVLIVSALRGAEAWGHLLLHAGSGGILAATSAWLLTQASEHDRENET